MTSIPSHPTSVPEAQDTRNRIIEAFLNADGNYVSGTRLSAEVGISRTAIWKHIQSLENMGFQFEAVTRLGHRLTHTPNLVLEPLVKPHVEGLELGHRVMWHPSVDSTNAVASQLAGEGAPHGTIVTAQVQRGGRGRRGKAWFSPSGGLWMSVILGRTFPLRRAAELTLMTCVAVRRALMELTNLPIQIKWPNDLLIGGRKVCGILAEIRADGENVQYAVLGIGINVNIPATEFPEDVKRVATSVMAESGAEISLSLLTAIILRQLEPLYMSLVQDGSGFLGVIDEWRNACSTLGKSIHVQTSGGVLEGIAQAIDDNGVLFLRQEDGQVIPIYSGDVLF